MNKEDIRYFEKAGSELLQSCTGDKNSEFLFWNLGRYEYFQDSEEQQDDGDGKAHIIQFMAYAKEGSDLDAEYFAEELVQKYSPLYAHRCHCEHDCCGHYFTVNMDIYHKKLKYKDDGRDVYRWTVLIHNAINL